MLFIICLFVFFSAPLITISKLLNSCPYKGRKVSDVSLSEDGLIIVSDNGTKIGGVYYPDGYKLLVR